MTSAASRPPSLSVYNDVTSHIGLHRSLSIAAKFGEDRSTVVTKLQQTSEIKNVECCRQCLAFENTV